jgi:hypothetical protein
MSRVYAFRTYFGKFRITAPAAAPGGVEWRQFPSKWRETGPRYPYNPSGSYVVQSTQFTVEL